MTWQIYAVLRPPVDPPALVGIDGAALTFLEHGELCAAVSCHSGPPAPTVAASLVFGDAVMALWARTDVVPMRFGTCMDAHGALSTWLDVEHDTFAALLRLVDGCAEIGIRFPLRAHEQTSRLQPDRGAGHAYLAARARGAARRDDLAPYRQAECLAEALAGVSEHWRFDRFSDGFVSLDFLVSRTRLEDFENACRQMAIERGDPLYVSGPWPPYSFSAPATASQAALGGSPIRIAW